MPLTKQTIDPFIELLRAVRESFNTYDLQEKPGVPCAKGTITARLNNLMVISDALEAREPNSKDTQEIQQISNSLAWLKEDKDVQKGFTGADLELPETALSKSHSGFVLSGQVTYLEAISMLQRALQDIILAN
ncbi:hypothetical protein [Asticcacaulis taihuensis]|uniref:Uncharacterized protein n=1 Tax=Asticcacaulis taihuensis TaxID=260084 RepID=A0A1G4PWR5_9CAUL|nr:hypothetical protein [Asticcacaulis taihuensis]SCW36750.1 hypothetical protein SAMN02927928_0730 [Asticcacaulis taihuensis]